MILLYDIGERPTPLQLKEGEVAYNVKDKISYTKDKWDNIIIVSRAKVDTPSAGALSNRNILINGGFDVWQRATSATYSAWGGGMHTTDRWAANSGSSSGSQLRISLANNTRINARYGLYISVDTLPDSIVAQLISQKIENPSLYNNELLTFSCYLNGTEDVTGLVCSIRLIHSTGSVDLSTKILPVSSLYARTQCTLSIGDISGYTFDENSALLLYIGQTVSEQTSFVIANAQLERGSVATPFEYKPMSAIKADCYDFYKKSWSIETDVTTATQDGAVYGVNYVADSIAHKMYCDLSVNMRRTPDIVLYSTDGAINQMTFGASTHVAAGVANTTTGSFKVQEVSASSQVVNQNMRVHYTANAEFI